MADTLTSGNGRSGDAAAEDNRGLQSRERAAHYRDYAAQIRDLADGEQSAALRDRLIKIAREYEELATDDQRAQPKQLSRRRRVRSPTRARPPS